MYSPQRNQTAFLQTSTQLHKSLVKKSLMDSHYSYSKISSSEIILDLAHLPHPHHRLMLPSLCNLQASLSSSKQIKSIPVSGLLSLIFSLLGIIYFKYCTKVPVLIQVSILCCFFRGIFVTSPSFFSCMFSNPLPSLQY